ncbi:hypothetical protein [Coxiella endosymbiont of Ornithodoros amblus]|nr:hypothetical protein [Coxiella endosymbiont of Ornithodoros amblus]
MNQIKSALLAYIPLAVSNVESVKGIAFLAELQLCTKLFLFDSV